MAPPSPVVPPPNPAQYAPGQGQFGYSPTFGQPRQKNNNLAIASLICGLSQILLWILLVPGILAFIFGLVSIRQIKQTGEAGRGMAVTGVVLGVLGVLAGIIVIIAIIVAGHQSQYQ
jgi:hypothetical protein